MSVHRCPRCCNQWDSDTEDREGELCGNCEEAEAEQVLQHQAAQAIEELDMDR